MIDKKDINILYVRAKEQQEKPQLIITGSRVRYRTKIEKQKGLKR